MLNLQEFLACSAEKAATELVEAFLRLPEDKRGWNPEEKSRSALDLVAECALLNGQTAGVIANRAWPTDFDFAEFLREKAELTTDWERMQSLLSENTAKVAAAIRAVPDEALTLEIETPFRPMKMNEIMSYPYWNMSYHLGQTNYIASMLGCLD